jgi:hypothetical protein
MAIDDVSIYDEEKNLLLVSVHIYKSFDFNIIGPRCRAEHIKRLKWRKWNGFVIAI